MIVLEVIVVELKKYQVTLIVAHLLSWGDREKIPFRSCSADVVFTSLRRPGASFWPGSFG